MTINDHSVEVTVGKWQLIAANWYIVSPETTQESDHWHYRWESASTKLHEKVNMVWQKESYKEGNWKERENGLTKTLQDTWKSWTTR